MTKQQQVKNAGIYLIPIMISNILPLISLPLILSYLSPEEYGAYALSLAFASVVIRFCEFSLLNVFERNFFAVNDGKIRTQLLYTIVSFIIFIVIIVGIIIYYHREVLAALFIRNQEQGLLLFYSFLGWAIFAINNYYLSYLKNMGNAKLNVGFTVSGSIVGVLLNIYFVTVLKVGPLGLAFGLLLSSSLIFITTNIYFFRHMSYSLNFSILISSLKLSLPLVPTGILGAAGKQFDKYLIGVLASVGATGIYAISQKLSNLVFLFMTAIHKVYGPIVYNKMFSKNVIKGGKEIGEYLTPFAYISVTSALLLSLFSEEALIIFAPPEYLKGLNVINILCISFTFGFFAKQPQIMYAGKTVVQMVLSFINFLFSVIILYLFVNEYGLLGAAVGTLLCSIIYNTLLIWQGQKYFRIEYEWLKLSVIYGMLIFMSISIILFRYWEYTYYNVLIIKVIYISIFLVYGMYLKIMTIENLFMFINRNKITITKNN